MKPRSLRLFFRMIILYIGVISLAITFLLLFYYREFFSKNSQMSTENLRQVGRSIAEQIDIRLQHMDSIALQAVTNTIIVDQLKEARQDPSEQNHFVLWTPQHETPYSCSLQVFPSPLPRGSRWPGSAFSTTTAILRISAQRRSCWTGRKRFSPQMTFKVFTAASKTGRPPRSSCRIYRICGRKAGGGW